MNVMNMKTVIAMNQAPAMKEEEMKRVLKKISRVVVMKETITIAPILAIQEWMNRHNVLNLGMIPLNFLNLEMIRQNFLNLEMIR
jgi:hypothetical protein